MGLVSFLPLYTQQGLGMSASASGIIMMPLTLTMILSLSLTGVFARWFSSYRLILLGAGLCTTLSAYSLTWLTPTTSPVSLAIRLALLGLSIGPAHSLFTLTMQTSVQTTDIGMASGALQFLRQSGSTIGVAVFGAVVASSLGSLPNDLGTVISGVSQRPALSLAKASAVTSAVRLAIQWGLLACAVSLAMTYLMPIKRTQVD